MWSSTESSTSTIPVNEDWAFPVDSDILNTCYEDRDFFVPTEQFNENYAFNIFNKIDNNNLLDKQNQKKSNEILALDGMIKIWAHKSLYNDKRTLGEIYKDEKEYEKKIDLAKKKYDNSTVTRNIAINVKYENTSYLEKLFCYPKIMCNIGCQILPTKAVLQFFRHGITIFLIDLRFGSKAIHKKMVEHILSARKQIRQGINAERVIGFAFIIHGRKLILGLTYRNRDIFLDRDSTIILTADRRWSNKCTNCVLYANFANYIPILQVGDEIKIGHEIKLIVSGKTELSIVCIVKRDGLIKSRMHLRLPFNRTLNPEPDLTHEEEEDIGLAINLGCDYLISPCVTAKLVEHINWVVAVRNRIVLILQLITFNRELTITKVKNMFKLTNGFYIYSNGKNENSELRKYIVKESFAKHKLIIRSGFMNKNLCVRDFDKETLKHLFLYPDCIVTSASSFEKTEIRPVIRSVYPEMNLNTFRLSLGPLCHQDKTLENSFCKYIATSAFIHKIAFIAVVNNNGEFVRLLAARRLLVPILPSFLDLPTARSCLISRNVHPIVYPTNKHSDWNEELSIRLSYCIKNAKMMHCITRNEPFLFCYDSVPGLKFCDTARILMITIK